jgi:hypothetical protein
MAMQNFLSWLTACFSGLDVILYPVLTFREKRHSEIVHSTNTINKIEFIFLANVRRKCRPAKLSEEMQ